MSKVEVNTVDVQCGSTLTLGSSGKTVTLACGATQTGFGRTGTVDWCTTVKTSPLTAVSGKGYFVNTCGGIVTVTLPTSPSAGDIVSINDFKRTFATNNLTVGRGGSNIGGGFAEAKDLSPYFGPNANEENAVSKLKEMYPDYISSIKENKNNWSKVRLKRKKYVNNINAVSL